MRLIDIHTHLQFPQFDADRAAVIARARAAGLVGMINVGTDLATSRQAVALAEANNDMWATAGLHPTDIDQNFDEAVFYELARHPKVVAIGECGLDYFRVDSGVKIQDLKTKQEELFKKQIELALEVNKPLMIHCRSAYDDLIAILESYFLNRQSAPRGNMHFFAGDWGVARKFLDLGFTLSFAGPITFADQYDEVIINTPLDRLLTETDSPFAAPAPYRGRRNEPAYVREIAKRVAALKKISLDGVADAVLQTASRLFFLPIA